MNMALFKDDLVQADLICTNGKVSQENRDFELCVEDVHQVVVTIGLFLYYYYCPIG